MGRRIFVLIVTAKLPGKSCKLSSESTRSIISPTISTHQLDFWMRFHPRFGGFCLAIRQKVNHFVALHVDQNAAEFPPTTEGKVIYSKLYYVLYWLCWKCHHATQNGHPAGLYPQSIRHACSKHPTGGKPDGLNTLILPRRHACAIRSTKGVKRSAKIFCVHVLTSQKNLRTWSSRRTCCPAQGRSAMVRV